MGSNPVYLLKSFLLYFKGRFIEAKKLGKNVNLNLMVIMEMNLMEIMDVVGQFLTFKFLEHSFHYFTYQSFYL